jgi:phosphatidylinositol alpha-1,6-mannosyltransferase
MATRPLFLTRRFPPSVGGMETLSAGVWRTLSAAAPESVLVAHSGSRRALPVWLPGALIRTSWLLAARRVDLLLTGDAVMCAAARPLARAFRVPCATLVHGLDLTYDRGRYRSMVHPAVRKADAVLANSEATASVARDLGVPPDRVHVVRLGVDAPEITVAERVEARGRLGARLGTGDDDVLLLTLGRLVPRKGVVWFLTNVLPALPQQAIYVVAGDGEDAERVRDTIATGRLNERVRVVGQVDDDERELLFRGADLFVQPNVPVPGDLEGFGLVTVEAALRGLPVVASDLEGIADAVVDGATGTLLPPGDAGAWVDALTTLVADRGQLAERGRAFGEAARARYSERQMGEQLVRLLGLGEPAARDS